MADGPPPAHDDSPVDPRQVDGHVLLATKLRAPPLPPHLVRRSRLAGRLEQATGCSLTLIAAPAGSGKTTLLSAWLRDAPVTSAWLSLDPGDDDPIRFWSYALTTLEGVQPGLGSAQLPLQSRQPPPLEAVLSSVINGLAALPHDVLLVFDDYHVITAPPIHASITFLLEHLPPRLHLVIATRADPPLPLARWRARGQLVEIRSADLRFTAEEAASFLVHSLESPLPHQDIAALVARTEGWIAGLQLAALSLQGRQDIGPFMQAFTGTHRFIVDYLTEEVLAQQPTKVQRFLLQTSVLEHLCAPLCEAVTGEPDGQAMLVRLEAANLFLVPLDEERRWYRYHQLFAGMLRQRLQQTEPDGVTALHRRASAWHADHALIQGAVHHALAAGDHEQAARLIEQVAEATVKRGEVAALRLWLASLPSDLVRARVELGLWHGWLLTQDGQYAAAEQILQELEDIHGGTDHDRRVAAIRAFIAFRQGDISRTIRLAEQALADLPADSAAHGLTAWNLGIAYCIQGDLTAGTAALTEARAVSVAAGDTYAASMIAFELGELQANQGHLHQAEQIYQQALDLVADRGGQLPAVGPIYVGRGELRREWNELDAAAQDLEEGIARCQQIGNTVILLLGHVTLARVRQAQGDAAGARDLIRRVEQSLATHHLSPHNAAQLAAWHARVCMQQGNLAAAARWAETRQLRVEGALDPAREIEYLTWARLRIAQRRPAEVSGLLEQLLDLAERQRRLRGVLQILVLQALAQRVRGDEAGALARLSRALLLAEPEGYIRLFVDEGAPMAQLLTRMQARLPGDQHGTRRYRDSLLTLLGGAAGTDALPSAAMVPGSAPGLLVEPLSDRELEVLRLIVAGCSNREIAERLVIAVSTVKWYVNAIYAKLQVESRAKAIARAHELNIA